MALELAGRKIRVNAVVPAMVETEMSLKILSTVGEEAKKRIVEMHPLGIGSPIDIAQSCVFLLSDAAKWITGTELVVDGGYSAA
jgi:NAD(P)-dependent dehydrogenase (short-subunit alcohol dehydrogenase family)